MIAQIRLNKRNKTIKVVNRKQNLRLQHTGKTGPEGPIGMTGLIDHIVPGSGIAIDSSIPNSPVVSSTNIIEDSIGRQWLLKIRSDGALDTVLVQDYGVSGTPKGLLLGITNT